MEEGVYLLKLRLKRILCFQKHVELDLSHRKDTWKQWTIILGDNGTGKTTILRCISALEQKAHQYPINNYQHTNISKLIPETVTEEIYYVPRILVDKFNSSSIFKFNGLESSIVAQTTLKDENHENDIQVLHLTGDIYSSNTKNSYYSNFVVYGYGANRFMSRNSLTDSKLENYATLFDDDAKLINAEEWLLQLDYSASKISQIQEFAIKRRDQVKDILLELLPDIEAIRFTEPTKENLISTVEFQTSYGWVTIHQLSLGYKTMVAWMVDLAARMFERYPDSDNPLAEPAIVLVDEIDLHMHPKWQRKIFDYLSDKFPKTQFIVTAHSPLIVQSAPKDANIVLLRREGDHVVIDNDIESVHNWRIDQILNSDLFGNISQRKPEVEDWIKEREELLAKEKLEKHEEKRLKELEEQIDVIPTADNQRDIEAMEIIRKAADYLKTQTA